MGTPRTLTPEQREILALFDRDLLGDYFARRTTEAAEEAWDRKGWTEEDAASRRAMRARTGGAIRHASTMPEAPAPATRAE